MNNANVSTLSAFCVARLSVDHIEQILSLQLQVPSVTLLREQRIHVRHHHQERKRSSRYNFRQRSLVDFFPQCKLSRVLHH